MKKQALLLVAFCLTLQFANAQAVNFVFTVTRASSYTTPDGQLSVQYTNSPAPLICEFTANGGADIIGTGTSISGLYGGNNYGIQMYDSCGQIYIFDFIVDTSSTNSIYQLDVTVNLSTTSAPATFTVNYFTGGVAPYYISLDDDSNPNSIVSDTLNSVSNVVYNNLTADYSGYRWIVYDSTMLYNCEGTGECYFIGFIFTTTYDTTASCLTQIETLTNNEFISLFPNPSNGIYTITSSKNITSYSIFDALGRKVLTKTTNLTTQSIDIQLLNTGMYYLIAQFEDGTNGNQKLIKK